MTQTAVRRLLAIAFLSALTVMGVKVAAPADAMPLDRVITTIRDANPRYAWSQATLVAADCSGIASVAQSLAMGEPIRRWGDTHTLLAGRWPHTIPGASRDDQFVMGANPRHMVIRVGEVNIEARQRGEHIRIGPTAASPFEPRFRLFHIDPAVLR